MTPAATVAGRPLSVWSRESPLGTWHALGPADAPPLGALRIDRALLAPEGARERLVAGVLAVGALQLPGVIGMVDLVAEAGEVWLLTARPPVPTLADVLAAHGTNGTDGTDGPRPDAGSVASILNETAQTLLALHAAGLAHGSLSADSVVLATNGAALLAAPALSTVLTDASSTTAERGDVMAWAALARTLGDAWTAGGTAAAELFARCSDAAESDGLAAARRTLTGGRSALPEGFLERAALRAAAAAHRPGAAVVPEATGSAAAPELPAGTRTLLPAPTPAPAPGAAAATDTQATTLGRRGRTSRPAASDEQATVLGKRNRTPATNALVIPAPAADADGDADGDGDGDGDEDGEILLRFGPGVPPDEQETLRALWPAAAPDPARRRRRARLGATAALIAVAVALWLLLRPTAGPAVTAAEVHVPTAELHCDGTADLVGVMTTDGHGGPVTYRWLRSDGQDSGELIQTARRGEPTVTVHLRWTVRGPGLFRGSARLQVRPSGGGGTARAPIEARGAFSYSCP